MIKSESGGATVEVVFACSRGHGEALSEIGFAWCKEDNVLIRINPSADATVPDLLSIDAVCTRYTETGEYVLSARAYLCQFAFSGVNMVCKDAGFSYRKGVGWVKAMAVEEFEKLQSVAGTRSQERVECQRQEVEAAASEEKQAAAMEQAAVAKAANFRERLRKDPTYARRFYEYGQLLLQMSATGSYVLGSDGAPNWPDPPLLGEKGIVSRATEHLVPPRPDWAPSSF